MITKFQNYLKESLEFITIERNMSDIHEEFFYYEEVCNYLRGELSGEKVHVDRCFEAQNSKKEIYDVDIDVIDVRLEPYKLRIIFINKIGVDYIIPDNATLKWETLINRSYSDFDPYGEEEE